MEYWSIGVMECWNNGLLIWPPRRKLTKDSAEKTSVHPSRASESVRSLSKERTEERLKSLAIFRSC
jgi:hypothetical protein